MSVRIGRSADQRSPCYSIAFKKTYFDSFDDPERALEASALICTHLEEEGIFVILRTQKNIYKANPADSPPVWISVLPHLGRN